MNNPNEREALYEEQMLLESIEPSLDEWEEYFLKNLKEAYWTEQQLSEYMHDLIASATNPELIDALNSHLSDTLEQSSRLEDIFHLMKEEPEAKRCDGMETLIDEAHSIDEENEVIRDEALLLAVQRIEHFEIVSYRALMRLAKRIRWREIYEILGVSLREELEAERWLRNLTKRDSPVKEFNPEAY